MSASLVGSEMCIRDSTLSRRRTGSTLWEICLTWHPNVLSAASLNAHSVSYTHLTLPTICSV
eukprot:5452861-Alexandrium_andersonii.AAC.1